MSRYFQRFHRHRNMRRRDFVEEAESGPGFDMETYCDPQEEYLQQIMNNIQRCLQKFSFNKFPSGTKTFEVREIITNLVLMKMNQMRNENQSRDYVIDMLVNSINSFMIQNCIEQFEPSKEKFNEDEEEEFDEKEEYDDKEESDEEFIPSFNQTPYATGGGKQD